MRVVVTNVFGPLNRGDHELFSCLLEALRDLGVDDIAAIARDPDACDSAYDGVRFYEQPGKFTRFARPIQVVMRILLLAVTLIATWVPWALRFLPRRQADGLREARRADVLVACPGGYLEDSSPSLVPQLTQLVFATRLGKPLVLAPMSIGPVRSRIARSVVRWVLSKSDSTFVRERYSLDFVQRLGVHADLANDLAMAVGGGAPVDDGPRDHICATVVRWPFPTSDDPARAQQTYYDRLAKLLDDLHEATGLPVRFLLQVANDRAATEQVRTRMTADSELVLDATDPERLKGEIGSARMMVASRFHSAVFALQCGTPVIALAYLPKTTYMLQMYDLDRLGRPIDDFEPAEVRDALLDLANGAFDEDLERLDAGLSAIGDPFRERLARLFAT